MTGGGPGQLPQVAGTEKTHLDQELTGERQQTDTMQQSVTASQELPRVEHAIDSHDALRPQQMAALHRLQVTAQPALAAQATGAGQGYVFSPDQARELMSDIANIRTSIAADKQKMDTVIRVVAPAHDQYSEEQARQTGQLGGRMLQHLDNQDNFYKTFHDALGQAIQRYEEQERTAGEQASQLRKGMDV